MLRPTICFPLSSQVRKCYLKGIFVSIQFKYDAVPNICYRVQTITTAQSGRDIPRARFMYKDYLREKRGEMYENNRGNSCNDGGCFVKL